MSAIYGVVRGQATAEHIRDMGHRLKHRGPARPESAVPGGRGGIRGARAGFASSDAGWHAFAEGVVYNSAELRDQLPAAASRGTRSVADLILDLHAQHGPAGLEKIDGDFAAVLFNSRTGSVLLTRDFFGCRPLYYALLPDGGVAFASEYKALLALSTVPAEPDLDMVQYLQHAKRLPLGRTLLRQVHAALPGRVVGLNEEGGSEVLHAFAPLRVDVRVRNEAEASKLVLDRLRMAVQRRARDVNPLGLALSGGIDSIGIAFLLRELFPDRPLLTFTAGSGQDDPEIVTAAQAAKLLGSTHHEVITPPALLKTELPRLVWHMEDPYSRTEALQLFKVAEAASGKVEVLFSAQGADGLFAGMPKYMLAALMKRFPPLRPAFREFYNYTQLGLEPRGAMARLMARLKYKGRLPEVPHISGTSRPEPIPFPPVDPEFINTLTSRGFQTGVCQDIQKFERPFSAHGICYRSPFYDLDLVRSAYTISDSLKIRGSNQKYILRRALESAMPSQFVELKKFPQRIRADDAFSDALDGTAAHLLTRTGSAPRFFTHADLTRLQSVRRGGAYHAEAGARIWTLMLTELWAQLFVEGRGECPDGDGVGAAAPGGEDATEHA